MSVLEAISAAIGSFAIGSLAAYLIEQQEEQHRQHEHELEMKEKQRKEKGEPAKEEKGGFLFFGKKNKKAGEAKK